MGERMSMPTFRRWIAFDVLESSEADPEVTVWDDKESRQRKLDAAAERKREARKPYG